MNSVAKLISKYELDDTVLNNGPGIFSNIDHLNPIKAELFGSVFSIIRSTNLKRSYHLLVWI
jgi:hypothetical protein